MANIKLNNNSYPIPDSKLAGPTADFIAHLGTIAGSGLKVVVGGVEYGVDASKVAGAIGALEGVLDGLNAGGGDDSNVITWDGNIEGRESFDAMPEMPGYYMMYKVSDRVLSTQDVIGGTLEITSPSGEIMSTSIADDDKSIKDYAEGGYFTISVVNAFVVYSDNNTMGVTTGVYFLKIEGEGYISSLTLSSAPDTPEDSGVITWDGNTEGLVTVRMDYDEGYTIMAKVSDAIWTDEQIKSSSRTLKHTFPSTDGHVTSTGERNLADEWDGAVMDGCVTEEIVFIAGVCFVRTPTTFFDVYFPESGIYFMCDYYLPDSAEYHEESITTALTIYEN